LLDAISHLRYSGRMGQYYQDVVTWYGPEVAARVRRTGWDPSLDPHRKMDELLMDSTAYAGIASGVRAGVSGVRSASSALGSACRVPVSAPGATGRLVHLTDEAGQAGIGTSQQIIGRHGIFAVSENVGAESTGMKVLRTGLTPSRTVQSVPIPDAATGLFQRPVPIGPYSGWKYFGGVHYASPGSISTATGAFTPFSTIIGPNVLIYGPDALFYGGVGAAGGIYWYGTSGQEPRP